MQKVGLACLSLFLLLTACKPEPPVEVITRIVRITDSSGQEHIVKNPEVDYSQYSSPGAFRAARPEKAGLLTTEQVLPWSDIKELRIGKPGTRDTYHIPGDVPGAGIREIWHAEVTRVSGATADVMLLDTADGWLQGKGALGDIYFKLEDIKSLAALPDERTIAGPPPEPSSGPGYRLRIATVDGKQVEESADLYYSFEKTHLTVVSNVSEDGLKVYVGKAAVTLPWTALRQIDISAASRYAPVRTADITFADGKRAQFKLFQPYQFRLRSASLDLGSMKSITVIAPPVQQTAGEASR